VFFPKRSSCLLRKLIFSWRLMERSRALLSRRHLRDSSTAWKPGIVGASCSFLFVWVVVAIDQFQWVHYTDGTIALQEVHGVKSLLPLDVDEVFEVPADQVMDAGDGAGGDMVGVVFVFGGNHSLLQVGFGQVFHFLAQGQHPFGLAESAQVTFPDVFRRTGHFVFGDDGGDEAEATGFHLPPEFPGGLFELVVEVTADNGGVEVKGFSGHVHLL